MNVTKCNLNKALLFQRNSCIIGAENYYQLLEKAGATVLATGGWCSSHLSFDIVSLLE